MKFKDLMKPSTPPLDAKTYLSVITSIFEVGQHYSEQYKNVNHKLIALFDIPSQKDADGKPRQLSKWLTPGSKAGCAFLSFFGGLDNKTYTAADIAELDPADYVGRACQVQVTITEEQKNKIERVMTLPDGIAEPKTDTPLFFYSVEEDGFSGDKWDALPQWVREVVEKCEQYQQDPPATALRMPEEKGGCPI